MGKVCWDFPLLGTGNQSGNNIAAITMFKGSGIMDGLAREVCQNSLDAKNKNLGDDIPVKVKFELIEIRRSDFDMFDGFRSALKNSIDYWTVSPLQTPKIMEFLSNVQKASEEEKIPILIMSDYNTVGLNGVNAALGEKSFWDLLVNTEGISIKQDDSSAGSFGIGKNAPFAYSALNLVFYNTLALDGGRAFEGVTRLVTSQREYNGTMRMTQPIGKYLYLEDEYTGRPILPSDGCPIANIDVFQRSEIGTDVAVVGFKTSEYEDWEDKISVAILKNFVFSIFNGKLEVEIKSSDFSICIKKDNIEELLYHTYKDEAQLVSTRQIYETITKGDVKTVSIAEDSDLTIYVKYDEKYIQSLSRFRSTGMLINTTKEALPHFSVVVLVNDVWTKELSKTLREAEPPQHTEWKAKNITDNKALHNKAAKYIRNIGNAVQSVLDEYETADLNSTVDAGIGNYLPDSSDNSVGTEGTDGLKTDIKIKEIITSDGRTLFRAQYENAESAEGEDTERSGFKGGDNNNHKKHRPKIKVVTPGSGGVKGIASGTGKVKMPSVNIIEHRTYNIAGKKYRSYINLAERCEKIYVQFYAGREDNGSEVLKIRNYKLDKQDRVDLHSDCIGPIVLEAGKNNIYVEFENDEIMAVIPVFTMEVSDEK